MRARIIIDDTDRGNSPESPYTLNVHRDDDDGTPSRFPANPSDKPIFGGDIPAMLRDLADAWEKDDPYAVEPTEEAAPIAWGVGDRARLTGKNWRELGLHGEVVAIDATAASGGEAFFSRGSHSYIIFRDASSDYSAERVGKEG